MPGGKIATISYTSSRDLTYSTGDPIAPIFQRRPPLKHCDHKDAYDLMRQWMSECADGRENNSKPIVMPLPTRLIDVRSITLEPLLFQNHKQATRIRSPQLLIGDSLTSDFDERYSR